MTAGKQVSGGAHSEGYGAVREFALAFPEAYEEFPWGHAAIKVRGKIFVTLGETEEGFSMSLKLTSSNFEALLLPFTEPTHYGMGKHGWVTSHFAPGAKPPLALLRTWIEESFRAVAPKRVVALLDTGGATPRASGPPSSKPTGKRVAAKKPAAKKPAAKKPAAKKPAAKKPAAKKPAAKKPAAKKPAARKVRGSTRKKA